MKRSCIRDRKDSGAACGRRNKRDEEKGGRMAEMVVPGTVYLVCLRRERDSGLKERERDTHRDRELGREIERQRTSLKGRHRKPVRERERDGQRRRRRVFTSPSPLVSFPLAAKMTPCIQEACSTSASRAGVRLMRTNRPEGG
jgi:hypothetical protein